MGDFLKRLAVLNRDACTKEKCGYVCIKVCPVNRMKKECIVQDEGGYPVISEELCIGCGICVNKCPTKAISIVNLKSEIGEPIFQYGINSFRLYGLPLPKQGVCGLIGKNGIGKTTAIKILVKKIKPNFGNFGKKWEEKEILEHLDIEKREYFRNNYTLSYKPQNIEKIRHAFKGTVKELISNFGNYEEAVKIFNLEKLLDRKISVLSGGELQKVAIATAYIKNADIYFYDEPTNFLDIAERLRISLILKSSNKKVLVADHDLAILDYLSDYVYLFFGEENTYGVVSHIRSVRNGINEYLSGYLKDENIKFRSKEIKFNPYSETETKTKIKFEYPKLKKDFPSFKLDVEPGEIREGEVIGIVGRNALGKSTFVEMLAKLKDVKISYKPQYLRIEKDIQVKDFLLDPSLNKDVVNECKRRLDINRLLYKKLSQLSGGELQRVFVTYALSQEADLYLLDEPSAYLDIEDRLNLADLVRDLFSNSEKSAFIVDHDVIFIDAISSRLIVFNGEQSVYGKASKPMDKEKGMNEFLKLVNITMRRDKDTNRPRINKPDSVLDREQKSSGNYYYMQKK